MSSTTPDDDWIFPDEPPSAAVALPPFSGVWRVEAEGEEGIPYPTLVSALAEPPMGVESQILAGGLCLAQSCPDAARWLPTAPGRERIEREINGAAA